MRVNALVEMAAGGNVVALALGLRANQIAIAEGRSFSDSAVLDPLACTVRRQLVKIGEMTQGACQALNIIDELPWRSQDRQFFLEAL